MILKNKKALLLSSLLILLPIPVGLALQSRFPEEYLPNFGWLIFLPALTLLPAQWLCIWISYKDKSNQEKNQKPMTLVLWIMPLLSNLVCAVMFALLLDAEFSPYGFTAGAFGLMFTAIGNYMPKTRMNSTLGIKIRWTYSSEANWNATHRFAGKVWFWGGIVMLAGIFLTDGWVIALMAVNLIVLIGLPFWYSWRFYRQEKMEGKELNTQYPPMIRKSGKYTTVFLAVLLVFVAAVMFVGDLEYHFDETSFTIEADWYSDLTLSYDAVESLEYREFPVPGVRVGGYGSLRLLMGFFRNEEFGNHVRYSYYNPQSCIILTTKTQTYVLSAETPEETREIFEFLQAKVN